MPAASEHAGPGSHDVPGGGHDARRTSIDADAATGERIGERGPADDPWSPDGRRAHDTGDGGAPDEPTDPATPAPEAPAGPDAPTGPEPPEVPGSNGPRGPAGPDTVDPRGPADGDVAGTRGPVGPGVQDGPVSGADAPDGPADAGLDAAEPAAGEPVLIAGGADADAADDLAAAADVVAELHGDATPAVPGGLPHGHRAEPNAATPDAAPIPAPAPEPPRLDAGTDTVAILPGPRDEALPPDAIAVPTGEADDDAVDSGAADDAPRPVPASRHAPAGRRLPADFRRFERLPVPDDPGADERPRPEAARSATDRADGEERPVPTLPPTSAAVNFRADGMAWLDVYLNAASQADPARRVGPRPGPRGRSLVDALATRLLTTVAPAAAGEVAACLAPIPGPRYRVDAPTAQAVLRRLADRIAATGDTHLRVGDITDAVTVTVLTGRAAMPGIVGRLRAQLGTGAGGRLLASSTTTGPDRPAQAVLTVAIDVDGSPETYRIRLATAEHHPEPGYAFLPGEPPDPRGAEHIGTSPADYLTAVTAAIADHRSGTFRRTLP